MATLTDKLGQLLDKHGQRQARDEKTQQDVKKAGDVFVEEFVKFRAGVIKPLFEEVGNSLKQHGHDYSVKEQEYGIGADKKTTDAGITLLIYPQGVNRDGHAEHEFPSYSVSAVGYSKALRLHGSYMRPHSGGGAGPRGEYKLQQLSREVLEEDLLKLLAQVFPG